MMQEKPGLVSGVVRDPVGKPVTEARVYFTGGPVPLPEIAALTDHHGAFSLSAPAAGTYSMAINSEGFAPEAMTIPVASGQQVQLEIRLKKSA